MAYLGRALCSNLRMRAVFALVALLCLLQPSLGLYFQLVEGTTRCFLQEVPADTLVLAKYVSLDHQRAQSGGDGDTVLQLFVQDPQGSVVSTHDTAAEGRFAFTSQMGGEHKICLKTTTTSWMGTSRTFRFQMEFDFGEAATDYGQIAKQEHLSAIEVEVRKLTDKMKQLRAEQEYQKTREESFRDTSESTNSRVMWWSIAQTVVLVAAGVWQVSRLKNLFKEKKVA